MFRHPIQLATKGIRHVSFLGKERRNFPAIREKYDISHKWVFLRRSGKDDLIFVLVACSALFTVGCVSRVIFKIVTGTK